LTALLITAAGAPEAAAMSKPKKEKEAAAAAGQAQTGERKVFLWLNNIDGWNSIDDEHIVLYGGAKEAALVTIFGTCPGLSYAESIAVKAPLRYVDKSALGTIFYDTPGYTNRRCQFDTVEAVKDLKEAKALVAARKEEAALKKAKSSSY
jgi:hypothetical protein